MANRNDKNAKPVKEKLFQRYGFYCMVCGRELVRKQLFLHHIIKYEHTHHTTLEDCGLVCKCCHKRIHQMEYLNEEEYVFLNSRIRKYKIIN